MKITLSIFIALLVIAIFYSCMGVKITYQYETELGAEWNLADRSSTISAKLVHLDKFVEAWERQGLEGKYNALFFPTPDNSFDTNFAALKTLQSRLHQIEGMDIRSFEYQIAIQQITAQEQGEAQAMLNTLQGTWLLTHYFLWWDWVSTMIVISLGLSLIGLLLFYLFKWLEL